MKRLSYMSFIALLFTVFAAYSPINKAYAESATVKGSKSNTSERQAQATPSPEPAEGTSVKSGKSNSDNREAEPTPAPTAVPTQAPAESTTVKSGKSNTSD